MSHSRIIEFLLTRIESGRSADNQQVDHSKNQGHGVHRVRVSNTSQEVRELLLNGRVHGRCHTETAQCVEAIDVPRPSTKVVELSPRVVTTQVHKNDIARKEEAESSNDSPIDLGLHLLARNLYFLLPPIQVYQLGQHECTSSSWSLARHQQDRSTT